jgi:nuclear GTP-binding protein
MSDKPANKAHHGLRRGNASTNPDRKLPGSNHGMRDRATIKRLAMYKSKPKRNKQGVIVSGGLSKELPLARIAPNRRWFGNTHVVGQTQLSRFKEAMETAVSNPYQVLVRPAKLPWGLIKSMQDPGAAATPSERPDLLRAESFETTFGPRAQRKRPRLAAADPAALLAQAAASSEAFATKEHKTAASDLTGGVEERLSVEQSLRVFEKGQSKRIWGELWKVIDSSDVVVQVLDGRDPQGTRCRLLESHLRNNAKHKHMVFLLNKCDLVPSWATARWVQLLSAEAPTLAFHSSITNPFGKGALIQLLRQFAKLHPDRKQISVGFVGYPNVGKSSVINTLAGKKACKVAPIPGETKVWQYIRLMRNIFLVDCPGVVSGEAGSDGTAESEAELVLKGVVRIEQLGEQAHEYVDAVLQRTKHIYLERTYKIPGPFQNSVDFLSKYAQRTGKLLKGGEPDINAVAKMVLNDWLRGKIPYFAAPPLPDPAIPQTSVATDVKPELLIRQKLSSIRVVPEFSSDPRPVEAAPPAEENVVDWDQLYSSVKAEESQGPSFKGPYKPRLETPEALPAAEPSSKSILKSSKRKAPVQEVNESEESSASSDSSAPTQKKEKRMTTLKTKLASKNFYKTANVKNRSSRRKKADS